MWKFLLLLCAAVTCNGKSPPGKPLLLNCRSPDKETFTCWWEPGSDGGLPTTHRLFYRREKLMGTHECPHYHSAGSNTCYFDRKHTSIWVDYFLTVVASNELGNATSDTLKIDVMDIVKPNPPENIIVQLENRDNHDHLGVMWQQPRNTDSGSGWVTFKYEVRVKEEHSDEWKVYTCGTQKQFKLYTVSPGRTYQVQVRCSLDHSSWSEWSSMSSVRTTGYPQREKVTWILVSALSIVSVLTAACVLVLKRRTMKHCLLPPVPGPKIRGFDVLLLKRGVTNGVSSTALIVNIFPPFIARKDEYEDIVMVTDDVTSWDPPTAHKRKKTSNASLLGKGVQSEMVERGTPCVSGDKQLCPSTGVTDQRSAWDCTAEQLLFDSSYVEVERCDESQDMDGFGKDQDKALLEDYSRVKEVGRDNTVLLQRHPADSALYTDCTNKKPHHVTSKVSGALGLMGVGYVETIPALPLM